MIGLDEIGHHQQPVGVTAWGERLPSDEVPNKMPTAWEYEFHGVELSCSCLRSRGGLLVKVQIQKKLPEIVSGSFLVSYAL